MDVFTIKDWIDLLGSFAQVLLALAAFVLAVRIHNLTKKIEATNLANAAIECVNLVNQTALSSEENLRAIDSLYNDGRDQDPEVMRRRWAVFLTLQSHQQLYLARDSGIIDSDIPEKLDHQVMELLLRDDEVMSLLRHRGFDTKFVEYCERLTGRKK